MSYAHQSTLQSNPLTLFNDAVCSGIPGLQSKGATLCIINSRQQVVNQTTSSNAPEKKTPETKPDGHDIPDKTPETKPDGHDIPDKKETS